MAFQGTSGGVPLMDFSEVGNLHHTYKGAQLQAVRERTLADLGRGAISQEDAARTLLATGDTHGAMALSNLGNRDREFAFRQQTHADTLAQQQRAYDLQKRQVDAGLEGSKVPPGYRQTAGGTLEPIPGGPEDPETLRRRTEATDKGRQMSITDITKLTEEGQKYSDLGRFTDTFKPEYAGYGSTAVGNAANLAGRHLPEAIVGKSMAEGSTWWQGYDKYKNVVRHDLYGSALTAPETAAFERADITPGMTPDQISKNLALQKTIVENGLKRKAAAMVSQGYKADVIGKAYGVDLGGLGVGPGKSDKPAAPPPVAAPNPGITKDSVQAARANPEGTIAEAKQAIAAGAPREAVIRRLQQAGLPTAGL